MGRMITTPPKTVLPVSAAIICKNEEACIGKCLKSLAGLAEIVVVDSGSTDNTLAIVEDFAARGFPIRLIHQDWLGYAGQKQFALDAARSDWILSIDADEWLDDDLRAELPKLVAADEAVAGWKLRRTLTLYGRSKPVSLWTRPEIILRLVRRGRAHFDETLIVHEGLIADGEERVAAHGLLRHERGLPLDEQMKKEIVVREAQGGAADRARPQTLDDEAPHQPADLLPAHLLLEPLLPVRLVGLHPCDDRRDLFVHDRVHAPSVLQRAEALMTGAEPDLDAIEVIIPNLKRRYSGGTAANRTIAPLIARGCKAVWLGPDRPEGIEGLGVLDLLRLRFRPPANRPLRIWHARRNTEMLVGIALKVLGWRLALIFNSAGQREKSLYTRFLLSQMDAITATSETSASFVHLPTTVIHHGVDLDVYKPPEDRQAAFAATGLPGKYAIGTFGRVRRQKGSDLFVEAMVRLLPKYPNFTAVVVGFIRVDDMPFVEKLKARISEAGLSERIRFLGELPIEEVPLWYQRISIYVFASRVEGFGLTLLEAMAAGNAVVAASAGSAETIIPDEETGLLVPTDDVEALVEAIEPLMREPQRIGPMGKRARARVAEDFSREREVDDILGLYRRLWSSGDAGQAGA